MTKQKVLIIVGVVLAVVLLGGGGFMLGKNGLSKNKIDNRDEANTAQYGASDNSMDLSSGQQAVGAGNGLSVSTSQAMDLGQLGAGASGASQGAAGAGGAGGSGGGVNPSSFKDYEKYKDQQHALFGEIVKGSGAELTANKRAAVYYKGWLTNGQMFDQSPVNAAGQKQPLIFTVGAREVVPGMEEGVLGMKVGGKRLILIPPAVGYGAQGNGPVPPNSLMIFEVELVTVQ